MWRDEHVQHLEEAVEAHPGGHTGDFSILLRERGVYLDRKTIGQMLRGLPQFYELGEGLHAWYLARQLEPDISSSRESSMSEEEYRASLDAQWSRDISAESILKMINDSVQ